MPRVVQWVWIGTPGTVLGGPGTLHADLECGCRIDVPIDQDTRDPQYLPCAGADNHRPRLDDAS